MSTSFIPEASEPSDEEIMAETDQPTTKRRGFLRTLGGAATLGAAGIALSDRAKAASQARGRFEGDPFTLGVASGDPLPDSVVLWTRLAPEPLEPGGGMPNKPVPVLYEVATDEEMDDVVKRDVTFASPDWAHSVHADVEGLEENTEYYYQFQAGNEYSPVGQTKTAPAPGTTPDSFSFAFASCQSWPAGYYTAYKHMAEEDLDLVIHLGDYIYEYPIPPWAGERSTEIPRRFNTEMKTLEQYRLRHALYKTDENLQAAHAAFPWLVTWDDHEVENNYADEVSENDVPPEFFLERRANAYKAYFEHMPLRPSRMPEGPDLPLYRRFAFGDLVEFNVLDTRQYRSNQTYSVEEANDTGRTLLGDVQEDWLVDGLASSSSQWNVLAQQVPFSATDENPDPDVENFEAGDKWDGYRADRDTVRDFMTEHPELNPVVITGDVHRNYVYNIKADFSNPDSATVGTEYITTSITSFGNGTGITDYGGTENEPWRRFYNNNRGYVRCTLTPEQWQTDYRVVPAVTYPDAPVSTIASFVTEAGNPGARLVSEPPEAEPIEITEIRAQQSGNLNNEFVTLQNTGDGAIDFSGFSLNFEGGSGQSYTFGELTLGAGETVTVRNGSGEDTDSTVYTGFTGAILNNSNPDTVVIANEDSVVLDQESYSPV
jgi:alkaline phosphatase D